MVEQLATLPEAEHTRHRISASDRKVLLDYLAQITPLSEEESNAIFEAINIRSMKKGDILLREGQFCRNCYFVIRGCVRQYFLIDGVEKTTHFFTESQPINSNPFVGEVKPSTFYLVCMEDCLLIQGSQEDEQAFFEQIPRMEYIARAGMELELQKNQETFASYVLATPEERYFQLLQTRPDLIHRVPQYHLASYLGVTPESLSRIRKRMKNRR